MDIQHLFYRSKIVNLQTKKQDKTEPKEVETLHGAEEINSVGDNYLWVCHFKQLLSHNHHHLNHC